MSRRGWLGVIAGVVALALAVGALASLGLSALQGRQDDRLAALREAPPPELPARIVPPPREPLDCDATQVVLESVTALEPVYSHELEALEAFLDRPRVDGVEGIYGALERNQAPLGRFLDAGYCERQGEVPSDLPLAQVLLAADLVAAQAYVLSLHRDQPGALRWLLDLWLVGHEMRRWGLLEHMVGVTLADHAVTGVEKLMRRPLPPSEVPWLAHRLQQMEVARVGLGWAVRVESHRSTQLVLSETGMAEARGLGSGVLLQGLEAHQRIMADVARALDEEPYADRAGRLGALEEEARDHVNPLVRVLSPTGLARLDAEATWVVARERTMLLATVAWVEVRQSGRCPGSLEDMGALDFPPMDPFTGDPLLWDPEACAARAATPAGIDPVVFQVPAVPVHP